jgi:hypothetical protein
MNNGTFIATKVYIISEKNKYSRLFVKKFLGICALLAVVNGNIELLAPVVNRIALVVNLLVWCRNDATISILS